MHTSATEDGARPAPSLLIDGAVAGYGGPPIIREVTAQVGPGEIVTIVGPNGAGKSTLLKAVAGLLRVTSGRIMLGEREITNTRTHRLARVGLGYVPQNDDVFSSLTVHENLEMGGYLLRRTDVKGRIHDVLETLPILRPLVNRRAFKLSGGERKLVAIGRALMNRPHVLLLDEPTSGIAGDLSRTLLSRDVRRLASDGVGILLVEQKAIAALEVSDWGYVLGAGQTLLSCAASALLARPDLGEVFLGRVGDSHAAGAASP